MGFLDSSEKIVVEESIKALASMQVTESTPKILELMEHNEQQVRLLSAMALGKMKVKEAVLKLIVHTKPIREKS